MKNYKRIIASLVAIFFVFTPLVSFADSEKSDHGESKSVVKAKTHLSIKASENEGKNENSKKSSNSSKVKQKEISVNSSRPVISGIKAPTVLLTDQVGTWTLKAFDPQNGDLSYTVDWGDTPSGILKALAPVVVQTSSFTHSYANPGKYKITFTVMNNSGAKTTTTITVRVNQAPETLPVISNIVATSSSIATSTISWTTDVKSSSFMWFGTSTPLVITGEPNMINTTATTTHSFELNNLEASTTYYFVVGSSNSAGVSTSTEMSFVTPQIPVDPNTPVIVDLSGQTPIVAGETETVTVNAFDPQNGQLSYSVDWGDTPPMLGFARMLAPLAPITQTSTFDHIYDAPGTYIATFTVSNDAGLSTTKTLTIEVTAPVDTTAPVISNILSSAGSSTSTISWTTDEPATSKVFYSVSTPVDLTTSPFVNDNTLTTNHSIELSGLATSTTYHFVVESTDASLNTATSSENTFTTGSGIQGFTLAQIALHNNATSCWSTVNGSVYDLTTWIAQHPGGQGAILGMCGVDATTAFNNQHSGQNNAIQELALFKIGNLVI